jgi:hypothetical protein
MDAKTIEQFLHRQLDAWNAQDKEAFFAAYRKVASGGLQVEYVGRAAAEGWPLLEGMWNQQNHKIAIDEVITIVNGSEAACHNRNKVRGAATVIDTIELYKFEPDGCLRVRYFITPPVATPAT